MPQRYVLRPTVSTVPSFATKGTTLALHHREISRINHLEIKGCRKSRRTACCHNVRAAEASSREGSYFSLDSNKPRLLILRCQLSRLRLSLTGILSLTCFTHLDLDIGLLVSCASMIQNMNTESLSCRKKKKLYQSTEITKLRKKCIFLSCFACSKVITRKAMRL